LRTFHTKTILFASLRTYDCTNNTSPKGDKPILAFAAFCSAFLKFYGSLRKKFLTARLRCDGTKLSSFDRCCFSQNIAASRRAITGLAATSTTTPSDRILETASLRHFDFTTPLIMGKQFSHVE
jgi:hypothetical protein